MMIKNIIILIIVTALSTFSAFADIYEDIAGAIRTGNHKQIASFFNNNVDMTIMAKEDVYTKVQAEIILKDFFIKNPPKSFVILHQGNSKEGAKYSIGSFVSTTGVTYRTYFFVKQNAGKMFIQELRFEKE